MSAVISKLLGWLVGGGIASIGKELRQARLDKLNAQNDEQRINADLRIAELQAQQAILIAEQGSPLTSWIRPAVAFPFVIYLFKVIVWDFVLGLGTTPTLPEELYHLMMLVFGAYFLVRPFEKRIIAKGKN